MHATRHHVLSDTPARVAVDCDIRQLVHAGREIAGVTEDLDIDRPVHACHDTVHAIRVDDFNTFQSGLCRRIVKLLIQFPYRNLGKVELFQTCHV